MKKSQCQTFFLLGCIAVFLASCGAHSPSILNEHHHSIHIAVLKNETQQYSLEERMTRSIISSFQRDGRLRVSPGSAADLQMEGVIKSADVSPIGYTDLDRAIGYTLGVVVEISVLDESSGEYLIEKRPFTAIGTYMLSNEPSVARAQDVTDNLAEQVLSALIEGW